MPGSPQNEHKGSINMPGIRPVKSTKPISQMNVAMNAIKSVRPNQEKGRFISQRRHDQDDPSGRL